MEPLEPTAKTLEPGQITGGPGETQYRARVDLIAANSADCCTVCLLLPLSSSLSRLLLLILLLCCLPPTGEACLD